MCLAIASLFCTAALADLTVYVLDIGQGNCIFVQRQNGDLWLVDCGSSSGLTPSIDAFLTSFSDRGILKLKAMVITHGDSDHFNLIPTYEQLRVPRVTIGRIFAGGPPTDYFSDNPAFETWLRRTPPWPPTFLEPGQHDAREAGDGVWLLTASVGNDKNARSAVLKFANGESSILLTGDATSVTMRSVLANYPLDPFLLTAILIAPHHGGTITGDSNLKFINATKPRAVVFTAGYDSKYGHPRCAAANLFIRGSGRIQSVPLHSFTCYNGQKRRSQALSARQVVTSTQAAIYNTGGEGALAITLAENSWSIARCPGNNRSVCGTPAVALSTMSSPGEGVIPVSLQDLIEIGIVPNFDVTVADRNSDRWDDLLNRDCNLTTVSPESIKADCSFFTSAWDILPNGRLPVEKLGLSAGAEAATGFVRLTGELSVAGDVQPVTVTMSSAQKQFTATIPATATFGSLLDHLGTVAGMGELVSKLPCLLKQFTPVSVSLFKNKGDLTVNFGEETSVTANSLIEIPGTMFPEVILGALDAGVQRFGDQTRSEICIRYAYGAVPLRSCASDNAAFGEWPCPPPADPVTRRPTGDDTKNWDSLRAAVAAFILTALAVENASKSLSGVIAATVTYASGSYKGLFNGIPDAVDGDAPTVLKVVFDVAREKVPELALEHVVAGATNAGAGPKAIIVAAASELKPLAPALVAQVLRAKASTDLPSIGAALVAAYGYKNDRGGASSLANAIKGVQPDRAQVLFTVLFTLPNLSLSDAAWGMTHAYPDLEPPALVAHLQKARPGTSPSEMAQALATAYTMRPENAGRLLSALAVTYTLGPIDAATALQPALDEAHRYATALAAAIIAYYGFTAVPRDVAPAALALSAAGYTPADVTEAVTNAFGPAWSQAGALRTYGVLNTRQWPIALDMRSAKLPDLAVALRERVPTLSAEEMVVVLTAVGNLSTTPAGAPLAEALHAAGYEYLEANRAAAALYGADAWRNNGFAAFATEWKVRGGAVVNEQ
jgi:beta-lactamase superfamily II metal-dependent hydrolase